MYALLSYKLCSGTAFQLTSFPLAQVLTQALNFALVLSTALMMWKGLAVVCNTDSPVVVVLTWAPTFSYRV